jgi:ATP-dependent exoDNAse (exonuclease V) beta subunit
MPLLRRIRFLRQGGDGMSLTFNPGQREAVESRAERIVVSAGAGSGKTRVLVQRFVDRVLEQEAAGRPFPMRSVLLITFTDKAAGELTERVRRAFLDAGRPELAREVDNAWISTIHGFCSRIVRRHALELGVDPAFEVLVDPFAGLARTAAFECAAQRCLQTSTHADVIAELIDEGVADLRKAVFDAYDRARSKGASAEDTKSPADPGYRSALARLAEMLDESLPLYRQLRETPTVSANLAGYMELRNEVARVQGMAPAPDGARASFALGAHRGGCYGDAETKSLTRRINEALEATVQSAIDSLAAERAAAWRELLITLSSEYGQFKARDDLLDFEDLQLLTRRLWTERPDIAQRLGDRFAEVMVDEFQDTNVLQLQVIEPISHRGQCVVGDAQQSIYRFRDADVTVLEGKRRRAETEASQQACRLTVNYRSDCRLLGALNAVFGAPAFFGDDYLTLDACAERDARDPWPEDAPRVQALIVDKTLCPDKDWRRVESRALAGRLKAMVDEGHATADDIVILLRASTTMPVYVDALREVGFDVIAASSGGFYATAEYADVRALLRVLANPLDDEGVLALLAGGFGGLSDDALLALASAAGGSGLWAALGAASHADLSEPDLRRAEAVRSTIERVREARGRLRLADAVLRCAMVLGREGGLLARPESWANVRKAARLASEFERTGASDPAAFLRYLDDRETFVRREPAAALAVEGSGAVRVMTVHAAKGLEFPVVAVADLGHGSVNTHNAFLLASDGDGLVAVARGQKKVDGSKAGPATAWAAAVVEEAALDLAESKRVFYVACTRAERALVLAGSTDPAAPPREEIAADWVLEATRSGSSALEGLMALDILGADDVTTLAPHVHEKADSQFDRSGSEAPTLPEPVPIPPPEEVSYTALSLYERCAYRFFAERMLRVGSLEIPQDEDPRALGVALHATLELAARGQVVDRERLLRVAAANRLTSEATLRLEAAFDAVLASQIGPLIESGEPEYPFAIQVQSGVVRGSMDLVARAGKKAIVLDYKTGATWDATGARYAAQAEIYALALLEAGASSVHMRFVHVEAGCEEAEYRFTVADRDRVRARIERAFASMRSGAFAPLRAYDPSLCADCPVSGGLCRVVHPHASTRTRTR